MSGGLAALIAAVVVATVIGLAWQRRSGRFRAATPGQATPLRSATSTRAADPAGQATTGGQAGGPGPETAAQDVAPGARVADVLTEADLGDHLGRQATLVQFSTAFCAPCRPTRQILAQVAGMVDGVTHIDIDATDRMDLVRRLRINSTPTVLVLDPGGAIVKRASGLPRKADVIAALGTVIEPAGPGAVAAAGGD
jgi:thiol-disulfide isomerase/thioredoxin